MVISTYNFHVTNSGLFRRNIVTMGIMQGKPKENTLRGKENNNKSIKFDPRKHEPVLTDGQAKLLKVMWFKLRVDVLRVGVTTFVK